MIIDIHGHTNAPPSLYAYKSGLLASKGAHGKGNPGINEDQLTTVVNNRADRVARSEMFAANASLHGSVECRSVAI